MAKPNIVAIIQARMSSTRLPGKVMLDIAGEPMLVRVVERTRRAKTIGLVAVATSTETTDDPIQSLCLERKTPYIRGSHFDVLDRYYLAARQLQADFIVRITADCPLIDPGLIDETVLACISCTTIEEMNESHQKPWDFAANRLPPPFGRTYPIGLDTEVCTFQALEEAWNQANHPYQREHVMPYIYDPVRSIHYSTLDSRPLTPHPEIPNPFRVLRVDHTPDYGKLRWTVDTPQDLQLIRHIFACFNNQEYFSWKDVLQLLQKNPDLALINANTQHKSATDIDQRALNQISND